MFHILLDCQLLRDLRRELRLTLMGSQNRKMTSPRHLLLTRLRVVICLYGGIQDIENAWIQLSEVREGQ